jgi:hypothetical protein
MTFDRILAILGIILGLPGFLLLLMSGYRAEAILSLGLGLTLISAPISITWFLTRPPYTITSAKVTLSFLDNAIRRARLTKDYTIRPNQRYLTVLTFRNIAADGNIHSLRWNGQPIDPKWIREVLGEYEVTIHFPGPHQLWREFSGSLSYEATDAFNGREEGLVYAPDHPTKTATIMVEFPASRPCRATRAYRVEGAGQVPISAPSVLAKGLRFETTLKRPRPGTEYWFWWDW